MLPRKFNNKRKHRQYRLRFKVRGTADRPRLSIFRSARHMYAQVIDDDSGRTLAAASTIEKEMRDFSGKKRDAAAKVGEMVAHRALEAGVRKLVFDRNGFNYHGRVAAVSKAAHELGLLTKAGYAGEWPPVAEEPVAEAPAAEEPVAEAAPADTESKE